MGISVISRGISVIRGTDQKGIQCEDCLFWYHIKCINLPVTYYITLSESSDSWYCSRCTLPEFTDSFFEKSINESDIDKSAESDGYLPCDNSLTFGVNTGGRLT